MKRLLSFLLITMCICAVSAQSYSDAFDEAFSRNDVKAQREALQLWHQEAPDDVNLFIARYNFYANQSMNPNVADVDTPLADSALIAIDEGITLFPDRLDLRFGKIYFLGELGNWDAFVDEVGQTLDYSVQINHRWAFPNVPSDMMVDLFTEAMNDYLVTMFLGISDTSRLTAADTLMAKHIQGLAKRIVQLFPGDFPSTYMLALSHLMLNENDKAYKYLMRAEKISSSSVNLLQSLVKVCRLLGKAAQAEEYQSRLNSLQYQD